MRSRIATGLVGATVLTLTCAVPAKADALGDLIQFRTTEHGETCTRREEFGYCTVGGSQDYMATFMRGPQAYRTVQPPMPARDLCAKFQTTGFELFEASFVRTGGEVLLNCVHRRAGTT